MPNERESIGEIRKNLLDAIEQRGEENSDGKVDDSFLMLANVCGSILNLIEQDGRDRQMSSQGFGSHRQIPEYRDW